MTDRIRELIDTAVPPETELVIRLEELGAELQRHADRALQTLLDDLLDRLQGLLEEN